ncbi:hypothetical protein DPX16_23777 [Anabarilius grahami]|uniref:Uncharacterized protein n=1 Tax=Anabarilius grahami TaxID=495550 RepID=A0A3N0XWI5_ANAGA|nr:hypothetical protein DPX16_23777 [Anabarilius grahami]
MGLFLVFEVSAPPVPPTPVSAADRLIGLLQDGRSLERYVEEFVELAYVTNWPDACLKALFLEGLDESTIRFDEPADHFSLDDTINLILYLNGSKFVIEEVPPETRAVWPVRSSPSSSACPSMKEEEGPNSSKFPEFSASMQHEFPEFSAPVQPKFPEFSAPVKSKFPERSASAQPEFPEFSASAQPKFPEFSASVQPKSPEVSAFVQPKPPVKPAAEQPKPPVKPAAMQTKPPVFPAAEPAPVSAKPAPVSAEPAPVPKGILITYEGMSWIPSPDSSPAIHEPAPAFATTEPAPATTAEPAPTAAEPTPGANEPFKPLSLPNNLFFGGKVPVGGKDEGGLGDPPWPPTTPDQSWPSLAPDLP